MAGSKNVTGHCLCGGVTYSAEIKSPDVTACECNMCRRWTGSVLLVVEAARKPAFTGGDNVSVYRSSEWGERGFCKVCGTNLFWKLAGQDQYHLAAGGIDDQSGLRMAAEIFVDEKPAYLEFANVPVRMTGKEFLDSVMGEGTKD